MAFLASIRHNFMNLTNLSGRDARSQFWPYAGFIFVLIMAGMMAVLLPSMRESMEKMQQFAKLHPELATVESGPGSYSISIQGNHPELMPDMGGMMVNMEIVFFFAVLLLAAAVVRRLHDRDKSGSWGAMPIPFLLFAAILMPKLFAQAEPDTRLFFAILFNNMIYIATLVTLVVMLNGASSLGENRYGSQPTP